MLRKEINSPATSPDTSNGDILAIHEDNDNNVNKCFANEPNNENAKLEETNIFKTCNDGIEAVKHQSKHQSKCQSKFQAKIEPSSKEVMNKNKSDKVIIDKVNKMDDEQISDNFKLHTSNKLVIKRDTNKLYTNEIKNEDCCEQNFDDLLLMIQESVKDLSA